MEYDDPFGCLEALLEADPVGTLRPTNIEEIAAYLNQLPIPRGTSCVRTWWRENESRFPRLAHVAWHYLGASCTSVASDTSLVYLADSGADDARMLIDRTGWRS